MAIEIGDIVKFNGNAPRSFWTEKTFEVAKVNILPKGTKKGASLGVLNMCKKRDVRVITFKNHPKHTTPIPDRFLSKVKS